MNRFERLLLALAATLAPTALSAQATKPVAGVSSAIVGVVVDSSGVGMSDATVYITELQRIARTRADGRFRFDHVKPGAYTLGARALGYVSETQRVDVVRADANVRIELVRVAQVLSARVSTAERAGISGVIGDTGYRAVPGVTVKVLGSGVGATTTDSAGEFFLSAKPGHYMVKLDRPGYQTQLIGVTVPNDSGRRVAAWLAPVAEWTNPLYRANMFELEQRLLQSTAVRNRLFTHEDFVKLALPDAVAAVELFRAHRLDRQECAVLDGGPQIAFLWSISAAEIEFMEVNAQVQGVQAIPSLYNGPGNSAAMGIKVQRAVECNHVVWLRR